MEYHEDSSTKLQGLRHKATAPKKATTPRAARGGGKSGGGLTQPADHEKNTWVSTWMGEQVVENQRLEKKRSNKQRRVT